MEKCSAWQASTSLVAYLNAIEADAQKRGDELTAERRQWLAKARQHVDEINPLSNRVRVLTGLGKKSDDGA